MTVVLFLIYCTYRKLLKILCLRYMNVCLANISMFYRKFSYIFALLNTAKDNSAFVNEDDKVDNTKKKKKKKPTEKSDRYVLWIYIRQYMYLKILFMVHACQCLSHCMFSEMPTAYTSIWIFHLFFHYVHV
jgi:hypothetical protein